VHRSYYADWITEDLSVSVDNFDDYDCDNDDSYVTVTFTEVHDTVEAEVIVEEQPTTIVDIAHVEEISVTIVDEPTSLEVIDDNTTNTDSATTSWSTFAEGHNVCFSCFCTGVCSAGSSCNYLHDVEVLNYFGNFLLVQLYEQFVAPTMILNRQLLQELRCSPFVDQCNLQPDIEKFFNAEDAPAARIISEPHDTPIFGDATFYPTISPFSRSDVSNIENSGDKSTAFYEAAAISYSASRITTFSGGGRIVDIGAELFAYQFAINRFIYFIKAAVLQQLIYQSIFVRPPAEPPPLLCSTRRFCISTH
jgi:hypothetical protein